jgi:hypothetical protein
MAQSPRCGLARQRLLVRGEDVADLLQLRLRSKVPELVELREQ